MNGQDSIHVIPETISMVFGGLIKAFVKCV